MPRAKPRLNCLPSAAAKSWCIPKYLPLTSLTQIQDQALAAILARHQGIWSGEAEQYLLTHAEAISHD